MQFDLAAFQRCFSQLIVNDQGSSTDLTQALSLSNEQDISSFSVYQNNYRISLHEHLSSIFPICEKFVGPDFFKMCVRHYIQKFPPQNALMHEYGSGFPAFLRTNPRLAEILYVADIAMVEWYIHALQFFYEGTYPYTEIVNPALQIIESEYPLLQLWMVGTGQLIPEAVDIGAGGEAVAVLLKNRAVILQPISSGEIQLIHKFETAKDSGKLDDVIAEADFQSCVEKGFVLQVGK